MTPIALTPAARGKRNKRSSTAGHRHTVRRPTAPNAPRRVSGPSRPAARAATAAPAASPARKTARAAPTRAPRVRRTAARPRRIAPGARQPFGARAVEFVKSLPDHQLLDRIVRGRAWIPLLGVLLAGIVAMQVEVLKLGAGIGRSIERGTQLQSRNELLRASVATLADDQRIERLAAGMGMVMPAPTAVSFLSLKPVGYVQRAASSVHQPDATSFLASLPATNPTSGASGTTDTSSGTGATTNSAGTAAVASGPTDTSSSGSGSSTTGG